MDTLNHQCNLFLARVQNYDLKIIFNPSSCKEKFWKLDLRWAGGKFCEPCIWGIIGKGCLVGPHAGHILVRQCLVRGWCGTATKVCTHPVCSLARVLELTTITWDAGTTTESESDTLYIHNMEGGREQVKLTNVPTCAVTTITEEK